MIQLVFNEWWYPIPHLLQVYTLATECGLRKTHNHSDWSHFQFMVINLELPCNLTTLPQFIPCAILLDDDFSLFSWNFQHLFLLHPPLSWWLCSIFHWKIEAIRNELPGLPWWRNRWESTCQCRGHGFKPWSGRIPHATEWLSLCVTTTEPMCHNYWSLRA